MGDISSEPSMEEILSSIKRIIAEEGDAAVAPRTRRAARPATASVRMRDPIEADPDQDEVLELKEPMRDESAAPRPSAPPEAPVAKAEPAAPTMPAPSSTRESIVSDRAAEVSRDKLEALSRMVVKPQVAGADTLEGLVRELLKPMLRDWLDANLPRIVETMVSREIERITGGK